MKKIISAIVLILLIGCAAKNETTKSSLVQITRIEDGWYKGYQNCNSRNKLPNSNADGTFVWVKIEDENVTFVGRNQTDAKSLNSSNFLVNHDLVVTPKTYSLIKNNQTKYLVKYEYNSPVYSEKSGYQNNGEGLTVKCKISLY